MNELALFAGAGGGILGGHLLGWRTVCAVEWEPYPASVLCARQNDGFLPPFPVWDDVQTFDGKPWRGIVDVVSGGFPCQDISAAGKGAGIDGERSGMWREMARIIYEVRPKFVFVENSPMLTSRGLGRVLGDLAEMGFDAKWGVLGAADVGAPHQRDRIWIVGKATNATSIGSQKQANQRIMESQGRCELQLIEPRDSSEMDTKTSAGWRDVLSHAEHEWIGRWEQQSQSLEKANVANPDGINDALRGNGENNAETMVGRGVHTRGSISNSGAGCQEVAGESSDVANTTKLQCNGGDNNSGKLLGRQSIPESGNGSWENDVADTRKVGFPGAQTKQGLEGGLGLAISSLASGWWDGEPGETPRTVERGLGRVADGVASRVDRLKAIGNGQVSEVARRAWEVLSDKR